MRMIVWKIIGEFNVRLGRRTGEKFIRVAFKPIEDTGQQVHFLNLPNNFPKFEEWHRYLKPGNVLDVNLQGNHKNINYFMPFKVIKEVDGVTYEQDMEE